MFDGISYEKGGAVLKMAQEYLTPEVFFKGVSKYLKAHAHGNAKTTDLWDAVGSVAGKDMNALMGPWTRQTGYPIVTVTEEHGALHVEQHRFLQTSDTSPKEDTLWPLVFNVRTSKGVKTTVVEERQDWIPVDLKDEDFFFINTNVTSIFRTKYSPLRLRKLASAANSGRLNAMERISLISDACALAQSGHYPIWICLDYIKSLTETELQPWQEILVQLEFISSAWVEHEEISKALKAFQQKYIGDARRRIGAPSKEDPVEVTQLKNLLFVSAALAGDADAVKECIDKAQDFLSGDESAIDQNTLGPVLAVAMLHGGEDEVSLENRHPAAPELLVANSRLLL